MTALQFMAALLEREWTPSVTGRVFDLPAVGDGVEIVFGERVRQHRVRTTDVIRVGDFGDVEYTPLGFGWTHDQVDMTLVIQCRASEKNPDFPDGVDGRIRVFGYRNRGTAPDQHGLEPLATERHGGLTGEVVRILQSARKGSAEFDLLFYGPVQDQATLVGDGMYRGDVVVAPRLHASEVDPTP